MYILQTLFVIGMSERNYFSPIFVACCHLLNVVYVEFRRKKFILIEKKYFFLLHILNIIFIVFCVLIF